MPALYLLLHFLEAILDLLLSNFARGFIFGFSTDYTGLLEFLSPTVYLYGNVMTNAEYRQITNSAGEYVRNELVSVRMENLWIIAVYALAGAALLAFAFALYRRRQSERAGDVVAFRWLRPLFRGAMAAIGALGLYVSNQSVVAFQPMNINFGIIPPLGYRVKGKRNKNAEISRRALEALEKLELKL